jgi:hypothetical protein
MESIVVFSSVDFSNVDFSNFVLFAGWWGNFFVKYRGVIAVAAGVVSGVAAAVGTAAIIVAATGGINPVGWGVAAVVGIAVGCAVGFGVYIALRTPSPSPPPPPPPGAKDSRFIIRWNGAADGRSVIVQDYIDNEPQDVAVPVTGKNANEFELQLGKAIDVYFNAEAQRNPNGTQEFILLKDITDSNKDFIEGTIRKKISGRKNIKPIQYWSDTHENLPQSLP